MRRLLNLLPFRRRRLERDLDRELRYHIDRRADELVESGLSQNEARRQAALEFGGVVQVQEEVRETWSSHWLSNLGHDVRYALRTFARTPGFTIVAVLSLALGIGANTAIFSILDALVLRSLPVSEPARLVVISRNNVSSPYPLFVDLRDRSRTLDGVLAFRSIPMRMTTDRETERVKGVLVSGTYFDVLGLRPFMGTMIMRDDDQEPGSGGWRGPVAVLSHDFWRNKLGGQRSIIGSRVLMNGHPLTIVGIAPPGFEGTEVGESADIFVPMMMQEAMLPGLGKALEGRLNNWIRIMGRLKTGVDVRQAEAELTTLSRQYMEESLRSAVHTDLAWRRNLLNQRMTLLPGYAGISGLRKQYSKPLWLLMAVIGLVLLIACANVANLLLSRATARRREIAIRLGLGAARSRLISQLLTESLILAAAGGASGLLLARALRDLLLTYLPPDRSLSVPLDGSALLFTLTLSVGAALLFGLAPAFQSTRVEVGPSLKGEEMTSRPARFVFRKGLVVFQISLSILLLVAATLFLRSLHNLTTIDPGFARADILLASVEAESDVYPRLLDEARHLPGVISAALADSPPLGTNMGWNVFVPGYTPTTNEPRLSPWVEVISPGYFTTMNIPLLVGREIDDHDLNSDHPVMVVNETFARHFFPRENPVGRRVGLKEGIFDWEIIGVVKDGKYTGLREDPMQMIYVPYSFGPWGAHQVIHLRTSGSPVGLASALRTKVRGLDKTATVFDVHTVQEEVDRSLLRERVVATMTGLFGGLALVLTGIGLYGLVAYGVTGRTREFGIRIAVGAKSGSIVGLVLREVAWLLVAGIALGLASAWVLGRLVEAMLFGIQPTDPVSAALAILVLLGVTLVAAWVPAHRASRVDPVRALRYQ